MYCFWLPLLHLQNLLCVYTMLFSAKLLRYVYNICGEREEELVLSSEPRSLCNAAQLHDGFPVYLLTNSTGRCGYVPPEPKLIHSFDVSAWCTFALSAPRTPCKVLAWSHCAHGVSISCWWLLSGHEGWTNTAPAPVAAYSLATEVISAILFSR